MLAKQVRELFLNFFSSKDHKIIPSSPLVPKDDPTLLFTTAGMVQFKPYFLGQAQPPHTRLASCQKCFRTTDISSIGDHRHLTFFEMLGNFSFGDYFKKEAISWGYEFVTKFLKLPKERLWVTVYLDDDESYKYWGEIGIPESRIRRFGKEDNFWGPAGGEGPCGPCSEIHFDFGEEYGCGRPECGPNCQCQRFMEIWNLVFIQFDQDRVGNLKPLSKPCIDTGMGLERVCAVLNNNHSVYSTELFTPLIQALCRLSGYSYGDDEEKDRAVRIIVEHIRGIAFLLADGVFPSNEERGYVLRRLIRRAKVFAYELGLKDSFLPKFAQEVINGMGDVYPELILNRDRVLRFTQEEEDRFSATLQRGLERLFPLLDEAKEKGVLGGEKAFQLHDTYGFPLELTTEIAHSYGIAVDLEGFKEKMAEQKKKARLSSHFITPSYKAYKGLSTQFVEVQRHPTIIQAIIRDGERVERAGAGEEVEIILPSTPFYGEMGGQVGDTGFIFGTAGKARVKNTIRPVPEVISHQCLIEEGVLWVGQGVVAEIDEGRRKDICRNHTATHLLQAALRSVLGEHVYQQGSLVSQDRLRFDFLHPKALTGEELREVQKLVNRWIRENRLVRATILPYKEAIGLGAIALFGEKYGEMVRMVEIEGVSRELCGGTHLRQTGEAGLFLITDESSLASGVRRIEAVTGEVAEEFVLRRLNILDSLCLRLESNPDEIEQRLSSILEDRESKMALLGRLERELARRVAESLILRREVVGGINFVSAEVEASSVDVLGQMADFIRGMLGSGVVVLGAVIGDRPQFVAAVTSDLVGRGIHAGELAKAVAKVAGGGGGGKPTFARAGGRDKNKLKEALSEAKKILFKAKDEETQSALP